MNENLLRAIRLTREMLALADEGDRDRNDDSCGIIYGVLRDAAYRIRQLAEVECNNHKANGKWDTDSPDGCASQDDAQNDMKGRNRCQV